MKYWLIKKIIWWWDYVGVLEEACIIFSISGSYNWCCLFYDRCYSEEIHLSKKIVYDHVCLYIKQTYDKFDVSYGKFDNLFI